MNTTTQPKTASAPAPMTDDHIEAILARFRSFTEAEERAVIWMTIGGMQHAAVATPNARVRQFFDTMERHIAGIEQKNASLKAVAA